MAKCVYEIHLQVIMVVGFILLDQIFILMNFIYHGSLQEHFIKGIGEFWYIKVLTWLRSVHG